MLNKENLLTLQQAAHILSMEEKRLREIDVLDPRDMYYLTVAHADEALGQLIFRIKKDNKLEPYWHEDLLKNVRAGEFRKGCLYLANVYPDTDGSFNLVLYLIDTSEEDGWEFPSYIDLDCVQEDLRQMFDEGYNIELKTNLNKLLDGTNH